ncbi:MAG TPA: 30S ribosomal protein S4 [Methanothrix soehngenii]|jgi:small subunit ribosomal protein S4|uniref:Small ribosomal subunit protein uS4 n=2 Tax=root TaxID=1 RepID=F4BXF1_METSG|nr:MULTISPECIES: 30S ribosomal protein S4 [Methanothrix]NYT10254.1 30S ribosomal protein S4 [Methanosarcinales archaeon]OPX82095.1 MAG: 30S ribosomal protein S4 [Methanosaeta sp. PtaB.Bin005]AEB67464.1 ribosomal protein S4 [Methanothrix soehngenii GP6]MBP7069381.1 30S ribosomal protein S4 [Methanothrix sp.]MDD3552242.1 30S ribosomal protein S4 [Methanothrix soehngenii]
MGYPGKSRKMYARPRTPWQAERIAGEVEVVKAYGLRNKRELWKAQAVLKKYRQASRKLLAAVSLGEEPPQAQAILNRLKKLGMLKEEGDLDSILSMKVNDVLERRLQTQVYRQGLANSLKQARQFIVHGHIQVSGRRVDVPGYLVPRGEEMSIDYYMGSPMASEGHPERASRTPRVEG